MRRTDWIEADLATVPEPLSGITDVDLLCDLEGLLEEAEAGALTIATKTAIFERAKARAASSPEAFGFFANSLDRLDPQLPALSPPG